MCYLMRKSTYWTGYTIWFHFVFVEKDVWETSLPFCFTFLLYLSFHSPNLQWHFRKAGEQDEIGKFKLWRESPDLHGFWPWRLLGCCLQDSPSQPGPWCLRSLSIQGSLSWQRKKRDSGIAGCHLCSQYTGQGELDGKSQVEGSRVEERFTHTHTHTHTECNTSAGDGPGGRGSKHVNL